MQAECLTWKDLSEATILEILEPKETSEVRRYKPACSKYHDFLVQHTCFICKDLFLPNMYSDETSKL